MDLPPDKAKLLKNYDNEKKWDIICDQVKTINFDVIVDDKNLFKNHFRKWFMQKIRHHTTSQS